MCTLRKLLGRHLMHLGLLSIVVHESGPHASHLLCSDVPVRRGEVSRVQAEPEAKEDCPESQDPIDFQRQPRAIRAGQVQPAGTIETQTAYSDRMLRWVLRFATCREGCMIT